MRRVLCRAICEVSYSAADDTLLTVKQVRIINANARKQCKPYGLMRRCEDLVK